MKQIWLRLKGETPAFFKKLQLLGGALVGIDYGILHIQATAINLPAWFISLGGNIAMIGATVCLVSQFAVKSVDILEGKEDKELLNIVNTPTTGGNNISQQLTPTI